MARRNADPEEIQRRADQCLPCTKAGEICLKDIGSQSELCVRCVDQHSTNAKCNQAILNANMAAANLVVEAIDAYEEAEADPSRAAELPALEQEYKNKMKALADLERAAARAARTVNLPIRPAGASVPAGPSAATRGDINPRVVAAVQQAMAEFASLMRSEFARMNTQMALTRTEIHNQIELTRAHVATQMELQRTEMELQRREITEQMELQIKQIKDEDRGEITEQMELQPKQIKDEDDTDI